MGPNYVTFHNHKCDLARGRERQLVAVPKKIEPHIQRRGYQRSFQENVLQTEIVHNKFHPGNIH